MRPDHPITLLRARLATEFAKDLPARVHPIPSWCREPQFFPGATGLLAAASWAEVVPGTAANEELLPAPQRGALVVGNYQATLSSYQRVLDGSIGERVVTSCPWTCTGLGFHEKRLASCVVDTSGIELA